MPSWNTKTKTSNWATLRNGKSQGSPECEVKRYFYVFFSIVENQLSRFLSHQLKIGRNGHSSVENNALEGRLVVKNDAHPLYSRNRLKIFFYGIFTLVSQPS